MAEFFVAKKESGANGHLVHDKNCEALTPLEDFKYLGSFASKEAAISKARGLFYSVHQCDSCLPAKAQAAA